MNRARAEGANNIMGDYLYEVKQAGGAGVRAGGPQSRPGSAGPRPPVSYSDYY